MKVKNFLIAGVVGAIVNYLLGWVFYGMLFKSKFPQPAETSENMTFIFLGCLSLGLFMAYIYTKWAQIATFATGAKAGLVIGLFMALVANFFGMAMHGSSFETFAYDLVITLVMSAITGGVIGLINGKLD